MYALLLLTAIAFTPVTIGGTVSGGSVVNVESPDTAGAPPDTELRTRKWYCVLPVSPVRATLWFVTIVVSSGVDEPYAAVVP
jgi:hypothetical protein